MKHLLNLGILLFFSTLLQAQNCNSNQEAKILLIGDSWANFMHLNRSIEDALDNFGYADLAQISDNVITSPGARTTDILDSTILAAIEQSILDHPSLEYVHLSIGGNDVLYTWDTSFSANQTAVLEDTVFNRTIRIIDFIHSIDPELEVVWSGYVFANFGDVIGALPSALQTLHPFYGTWQGMGFPDFAQINQLLRDFSNRVSTYADNTPKVHFFPALGLMQYLYGQNDPIAISPFGTYAPFTAPIDTGFLDFPTPSDANLSLGTIPFTSIELDDCFHLSPFAYEQFMDYQFDQYYMQALMQDQQVFAISAASVNSSSQINTEFDLGTSSQDSNRLLLDYNFNLPDTGIGSARLFLKRQSIENGNLLNQAGSISIDLFSTFAGSTALMEGADFYANSDLSFEVCYYGALDKDDSWLRLDLPAAAGAILQTGQFQLRVRANEVLDENIRFYSPTDSANAPILDLSYGPKQTLSAVDRIVDRAAFEVYPNPSQGHFYWHHELAVERIRAFNIQGQEVELRVHPSTKSCELGASQAGIYILNIQLEDGQQLSHRIVLLPN